MKKIFILSFILIHICSKAYSITLYDALKQTYNDNTQLNAERENFKASEEDVNISKAEYKPSLTLSGSKSVEETNKLTNQSGGNAAINDVDPLTKSIKLEQTLLDFNRGITHKRNIIGLDLASAKLIKKEQDIFYEAIEAYTQLILARETLAGDAQEESRAEAVGKGSVRALHPLIQREEGDPGQGPGGDVQTENLQKVTRDRRQGSRARVRPHGPRGVSGQEGNRGAPRTKARKRTFDGSRSIRGRRQDRPAERVVHGLVRPPVQDGGSVRPVDSQG